MPAEILEISARQVFTKRPNPGVEATVRTAAGCGRAVCTGGVSVGSHEVAFRYDGDAKWHGKGMQGAVDTINEVIAPRLRGVDCSVQSRVDEALLSVCENAKETLGGNAIAAVSAAALKAGAASLGLPLYRHIGGERAVTLPVPGLAALGGGERYGGGVQSPGIKPSYAFMCYDFATFADAAYAAWELARVWQEELKKKGLHFAESAGSFGIIPPGIFAGEQLIWELMAGAIRRAGYEGRIGLQVDVAADSYYDCEAGVYRGIFTNRELTPDELLDIYGEMVRDYPFVVIEDPFHEDDYQHHAALTKAVDIQVVGDDLFTTNTARLRRGMALGACNTVLLKVNQIGTITEALEMVREAQKGGWGVMPCDSRGEGEAIADYCVGIGAGTVRECALGTDANRFLEIEAELGSAAVFAGRQGLGGRSFADAQGGK